jgi:hypothetical protein
LYNANDRLATINLSDKIDSWIAEGLFEDMERCFVPLRDDPGNVSNEEEIFYNDVEAIKASAGITGFLDGATYDSGCAFEIGLAYALGYPISIITTDFLKWSVGDSADFYYVSKLLQHIARLVAVPDMDQNIPDYRERNNDQLEKAYTALRINLIEAFGTAKTPIPIEPLPVKYDYYLDPNFNYTESGQNLVSQIISAINAANKTYVMGNNKGDIEADIDNLRQSAEGIFLSDVYEPNVDSGILQGIAYGIGRKPITYHSNKQRYLQNVDWTGSLNCMITYSASAVVTSMAELVDIIAR